VKSIIILFYSGFPNYLSNQLVLLHIHYI